MHTYTHIHTYIHTHDTLYTYIIVNCLISVHFRYRIKDTRSEHSGVDMAGTAKGEGRRQGGSKTW